MVEISEKTIRAYALENAIKYKGSANQGAVLAGLFAEGLEKSEIKNIMPTIQKILKKINSMTPKEQQKEFESLKDKTSKRKIRTGLKELENAENEKVTMRLAPFPSGPLHIGNARNMILNDEYAKMYNGKLNLWFDDTIGSANKMIQSESYNLIKEGLDWLGITYNKKILHKSSRIPKYYEYAEELLKKGYLYVCKCPQEEMQDLKKKGIACACRELPPERQIKRWKEMKTAPMGSMTVRLKTSMSDPDPAFRDRVMFKISDLKHPKLGNKFRVYPSMEFVWAIDDHIFNSTHILRGTDHQMSTRVQDFIRNIFNWPNPISFYAGQLEIEGVKISKSKGTQKIKSGEYTGWNDPRTWSLQSLRDRGFQPKAIRDFILNLGIKKANITTPVENLYIANKSLIGNSLRFFFIENPTKIKISGCPELTAEIPNHPSGELGTRKIKTTQELLIPQEGRDLMTNDEYRLLHLLNFKSDKMGLKPRDFSYISQEPTGKKLKFMPWLPNSPSNIKTKILMPSGEFKSGLGEEALKKLKVGDIVNFEQVGFARLHKKQKDSLEFWFAHN